MSGRRRCRGVALVVALGTAAAALGGCRTFDAIGDTRTALERAGYRDVDVGFSDIEGVEQLEVEVTTSSFEGGPDGQANQAAGIVWTTFPLRFDRLRVEATTPETSAVTVMGYQDLESRFGPRAPGFDRHKVGDDIGLAAAVAAGGAIVAFVVFVAVSVLALVLGVRAHRKRSQSRSLPWPPPSAWT